MTTSNAPADLGFDPDALRAKYRAERDKRLRADHNEHKSGEAARDPGKTMELADFEKMNQMRARVDAVVKDAATAEALKPWYRQFCKRPCFHDEYLETFNRPNVTLVDTKGRGVERITPKGVVANGVEHELDCLIYATGFEVGTAYTRRSGYETTARAACRSARSGRTACAPCTACTRAASPTASTWARSRARSP
jgi:cation diffusion facilitator CzcD-associated flavoprotein CzcO